MQKNTRLESIIEAILFFKAEPITVKKISVITGKTEEEIYTAISNLKKECHDSGRGITVIEHAGEVTMATSDSVSDVISALRKEELEKDLGKAGLETLSIILYQGPVSRSEIDFIRGVNSQFILRNLLVRGLVEKVDNPNDQRVTLYKPTLELYSHLGIKGREELPEFEQIQKEIELAKNNIETEK